MPDINAIETTMERIISTGAVCYLYNCPWDCSFGGENRGSWDHQEVSFGFVGCPE